MLNANHQVAEERKNDRLARWQQTGRTIGMSCSYYLPMVLGAGYLLYDSIDAINNQPEKVPELMNVAKDPTFFIVLALAVGLSKASPKIGEACGYIGASIVNAGEDMVPTIAYRR